VPGIGTILGTRFQPERRILAGLGETPIRAKSSSVVTKILS